MEAAAGRSGSLAVPSSHTPPRKEWRAISENSFRKNGGEESENLKLVQTDERTIYEEGTGPVNVDSCSITVNGEGLKEDNLQRRIQEISRQREDLQHMEIELRAQVIASSKISDMHNSYRSQLKEQIDAAAKLKEQLQEREQEVRELELNLEEKNIELRAVKIDNEAVWAKEDLFREQNKELATFRRERDNSESERAQLLKKILDFQEHIQDKENQFLALEEQHRVAQETILYKDEQLREVQAWMARVQEMDALQITTNRSLQAELRDRTEQFNQYWIVLQQQFVEMERHHLQTIQQLHLELAELRGKSAVYQDSSQTVHENQTDSSSYLQNEGNQVKANEAPVLSSSLTFGSDGKLRVSSSSTETELVPVLPPVLGMGAFAPVGQMATLHPFVIHQQGVPESISSADSIIPQSHAGHLQSMSVMPAQHWQEQQVIQEVSQDPNKDKYHLSQLEHNLLGSHSQYSHERSASLNLVHPEYLSSPMNQQQRSASETFVSNEQKKVPESNDIINQISKERQANPNMNSKLNAPLVEPIEPKNEQKVPDQNADSEINGPHQQVLDLGQEWSASNVAVSAALSHAVGTCSAVECIEDNLVFPAPPVRVSGALSSMPTNTAKEPVLMDERALLACIVRAIPAGSDGRIRISTTLPNRLGKMLAPLHWHDYKKHYGKLHDFVGRHPELFVIEEDYIHLCEGAQEIISATAAVAKVAAAAASSAPNSSLLPSVAVTPISQSSRNKKSLSVDSKPVSSASFLKDVAMNNTGNLSDKYSQVPKTHVQQQNGVSINVVQGLADIAVSSRKNSGEKGGLTSNTPSDPLTLSHLTGNGSNNASTNGRITFGGKKPERASGVRVISRR
ncbi:uncharacterized protein LOC110116671 isoform X2 [Dendrobium catenatum]|uniref:uncharacterized protein LOC110116671 isoform X2 n=1 Tax=Dendrobium catenatum TaxID=906689 RepID=UPI0009F18AC3|nr:uncharacterized protein LOC110116671 isoform X2 [Dendrobium catenatum]